MKLKRAIMAVFLCATLMLSGCGTTKAPSSSEPAKPALKADVTLTSLLDGIREKYGFTMPEKVGDEVITQLLEINPDDVEEYAGYITMVNISTDNLIAVKAKPGKTEPIQKALEARRAFMEESFSKYLPDQYEKAKAGKVITVGDYVFLVIMGRGENPAEIISQIETEIRAAFQ